MAMQYDPFSQQQELAQAYQLGSLEEEYVLNPKKILANFSLILVVALFAPLFSLVSSHGTANVIPIFIFVFLFLFVVGGGVMLNFYFGYRRLHVYVYSNGFLYLNGNTSKVVYWQQIKKASTNNGYLYVKLYNDGWVRIPWYVGRFGELRARIQQKIVPPRYSS
jgi:hypothetical protein